MALDTAGAAAAEPFARATGTAELPVQVQRIMGWSDPLWKHAGPVEFPCLLDPLHQVARLYDIVNVPTAVWIDEQGRIVRPPESAGADDVVRHIDPESAEIPDAIAERGRRVRSLYVDAVRDWVVNGEKSPFALSPELVQRRLQGIGAQAAWATAHFQLGAFLQTRGHAEAARPHFEEAVRLRPESWTFRRQKLAVADRAAIGNLAAGPEFWQAVTALRDTPYYPPLDLPGMPER